MTNAEVQSFVDEGSELPARERLTPSTNWEFGFPWKAIQTILPNGKVEDLDYHDLDSEFAYPTKKNLFALASEGIHLLKARLLGLWYHRNPSQVSYSRYPLGSRYRQDDGKRVILAENPTMNSLREVPVLVSPRLTKWEPIVYQFPEKKFTPTRTSVDVLTIEGNDQFFRIGSLPDDFLQILRRTSKNTSRGFIEYKNNKGNTFFSQVADLPESPSYTACNAFGLQTESIDGHTRNVLTTDSCLPREIKVHIYLTEDGEADREIFTQTVSYIGVVKDLFLTIPQTTSEKPSGTSVFFTPSEYRDMMLLWGRENYILANLNWWVEPEVYAELQEVQAEIKEKLNLIDRHGILGPSFGNGWNGDVIENVCSIAQNSSQVFLQKGHNYGLRVELDNVFVPLTLTNIQTLQNKVMYQPIKAYLS